MKFVLVECEMTDERRSTDWSPLAGVKSPPKSDLATMRQASVLKFIVSHLRKNGYSPGIRDIADHINVRSTNGVMDKLIALEKKGYIKRNFLSQSHGIKVLRIPRWMADEIFNEELRLAARSTSNLR